MTLQITLRTDKIRLLGYNNIPQIGQRLKIKCLLLVFHILRDGDGTESTNNCHNNEQLK